MAWWFYKKKAQPGFLLPCQSCGGKITNQFNTFSQVQKKQNKTPHLYNRLYTFQMMHRKKNVSKTNWNSGKMLCYHLVTTTTTNKQWEHYKNPPLPSIQPVFFSIQCCHNEGTAPSFALVLWIDDSRYGTLVDWILTLRNRKEKDRKCQYNFSRVSSLTSHSTCQTFCDVTTQLQYQ